MLRCNKGTTLRAIIHRIVWIVFRSSHFFLPVWQHVALYSMFVPSLSPSSEQREREREREKEPRYSTQCLDNYIYMCVFRFSGTSNVLSFLFSLIQAFIDLHTVHFSSPTNTGLSVFMFKLDCIEAKESMKQKDVNSFLAQENHLLT
jgi:hypothetical protein